MRDHVLLYSLAVIILLNITAIVILQNRIVEQTMPIVAEPDPVPANHPPIIIIMDRPDVMTLILEDECDGCFDIRQYIAALNETIDMEVRAVDASDLDLFASERLPAIAFNKSLEQYPSLIEGWDQVGTVVNITAGKYAGEWYVLPTQNPPYLEDGIVHGRVNVTYITMLECTQCYDVAEAGSWLNDSRITPYKERFVDVSSSEGKALVGRYGISAVPTIILSPDAAEYQNLQPSWQVVGTVEDDGYYVLRDLQRMQVTYYDLEKHEVMSP
jgi:hypothetical protein